MADAEQGGGVSARARRWTQMSEDVRKRTDLFAKTVSGLGTSALAAIGIAKFSDVFPLPPLGDISAPLWIALFGTIGGFVAMASAIVWFSVRLWRVDEPIFTDLALEELDACRLDAAYGLDAEELRRVQDVFRAEARSHGSATLREYADTATALERRAAETWRTSKAEALRAQAQSVRTSVDDAQARALVNVVRLRARNAVTNRGVAVYATFLAGLVGFGLGTDYVQSQHSPSAAAARSCAQAVRALSEFAPANEDLIPDVCSGDPRVTPTTTTPTTPTTPTTTAPTTTTPSTTTTPGG